jgi:hypothetical protein
VRPSAEPNGGAPPAPERPASLGEAPAELESLSEPTVVDPIRARDPVDVVLGTATGGTQEVEWRLSIRANPHLLMVGLPGMGKTTCLINICRQLTEASVAPIVFSYHDDIDEKLGNAIGPLNFVDYDGLGFNPLRITDRRPRAHIDVSGTLRDIFGSIFADLGDLQLEELRQAIKQSYEGLGWGADGSPDDLPTPAFRAFFDILSAKPKPNLNLLARLRELADYGFYDRSFSRSNKVLLTRLGGGAFGNKDDWIDAALVGALESSRLTDLR